MSGRDWLLDFAHNLNADASHLTRRRAEAPTTIAASVNTLPCIYPSATHIPPKVCFEATNWLVLHAPIDKPGASHWLVVEENASQAHSTSPRKSGPLPPSLSQQSDDQLLARFEKNPTCKGYAESAKVKIPAHAQAVAKAKLSERTERTTGIGKPLCDRTEQTTGNRTGIAQIKPAELLAADGQVLQREVEKKFRQAEKAALEAQVKEAGDTLRLMTAANKVNPGIISKEKIDAAKQRCVKLSTLHTQVKEAAKTVRLMNAANKVNPGTICEEKINAAGQRVISLVTSLERHAAQAECVTTSQDWGSNHSKSVTRHTGSIELASNARVNFLGKANAAEMKGLREQVMSGELELDNVGPGRYNQVQNFYNKLSQTQTTQNYVKAALLQDKFRARYNRRMQLN